MFCEKTRPKELIGAVTPTKGSINKHDFFASSHRKVVARTQLSTAVSRTGRSLHLSYVVTNRNVDTMHAIRTPILNLADLVAIAASPPAKACVAQDTWTSTAQLRKPKRRKNANERPKTPTTNYHNN